MFIPWVSKDNEKNGLSEKKKENMYLSCDL